MRLLRSVDFETTGFPPNAEVIEVGTTDIIYTDAENIKIIPRKPVRCKPEVCKIEIGARAVHHISEEDLIGCDTPSEVMKRECVDPRIWAYVACNAPFEQKFYQASRPWIDTLRVARRLWPDAKQHTNQYMRYFLNVDAEDDFIIDFAMPPHLGGPDSYVTAHVVRKMLRTHSIEMLVDMSNKAMILSTLPFGMHKGIPCGDIPQKYWRWILNQDQAEPDVRMTAEHYYKG